MKFKLFFFFSFLILIQVFAFQEEFFGQTTYYISSSQGNDSNNGTNPSTAWKTLAKLQSNLSSALPGDKFLLKRGDIWTTRAGVQTPYSGIVGLDLKDVHGTTNNYIIISAYGDGEKPTFNFSDKGASFQLEGAAYLKIENLKLTTTANPTNAPRWGFHAIGSLNGGAHHIIINNIIIDGLQEGLRIQDASHDITVENSEIKNMCGTNTSGQGFIAGNVKNINCINTMFSNIYGAHDGLEHAIYYSDVINGLVENNIMYDCDAAIVIANGENNIIRGNTVYNQEKDGIIIDSRPYGSSAYLLDNVIVEKNLIYNTGWMGIDIHTNGSSNRTSVINNLIIRNNVIYNAENYAGIFIQNGFALTNTQIVNNTIANSLNSIWISNNSNLSNIKIMNNIFYNDTYSSAALIKVDTKDLSNINLDYNLYYQTVGYDMKIAGVNKSLNQLQLTYTSQEHHGISANPLFVNLNNYDFHIKLNSPAKNAGINLFNIGVTTDYTGNARPNNTNFDIGAFQYGTSTNQTSELKIFLEGCYQNGIMTTNLDYQKSLPFSQPYIGAPWNYPGKEKVTSVPENVVDWVLVELRKSIDVSSEVAKQAAFINSTGKIVDLSGENNITFSNVSDGNYFVVIIQRNHLAVMSANPVTLTNGNISYDFTTDENKAYGTNALVDLGDGVYGMYGGDSDSNGIIDDADVNDVGNNLFKFNYLLPDLDLNNRVNVIDYKLPRKNLGKKTYVTGIFAL